MTQREIKFRIWCEIQREMHYDNSDTYKLQPSESTDGLYHKILVTERIIIFNIPVGDYHAAIYQTKEDLEQIGEVEEEITRWFHKDKSKIMGSTGLKDKNGKEIYGGDRLLYSSFSGRYTCIYEVVWHIAGFALIFPDTEREPISFTSAEGMEIIGNIHQNPNLLTNNN